MTASKHPPGIRFICSKSALALAMCGLSYGISTFIESKLSVVLPGPVRWTWSFKRDAKRLGAEAMPVFEGKWPGSIDLMIQFAKDVQNVYIVESFLPMTEKLGPVLMFKVLWGRQVFTTEPDHVKQILCTEFDNFIKGREFIDFSYPLLGVGVFNSDGEMWKFHRTMTRPFFHRDRINDFAIFSTHADAALARMKERIHEGYALDVQDLVSRFTLDSATEFLFGHCVHSLKQSLPYPYNARPPTSTSRSTTIHEQGPAEHFAEAFTAAQAAIADRGNWGPLWELAEFWKDRVEEPLEVVRAYIEPILEEGIRRRREKEAAGLSEKKDEIEDGETPLDYLIKHTDDRVLLRDEILNIMIAGRDTTASTMTFMLYLLATSPHVMQRLRTEILDIVGPMTAPNIEQIRRMKYLRAVINETLRLYPPVPFDVRQAVNSTTLKNPKPGGKPLYFPPGTGVTYSVSMMHRRKDLWGPDADEFDPDRFIDERLHKYLTSNPFIFLPFNAGPRICLGQQFAYNEISFMIVRLLQAFDTLELDADAQPPDAMPPSEWKDKPGRRAVERIVPKAHLSLFVHKGLWLRLREAPSI